MEIDQDLPSSSITNCCSSFLSTMNDPMQKQSSPEEKKPEKTNGVSRISYIQLFGKWVSYPDTSGIMIGVDNNGKGSFGAKKEASEKKACKKLWLNDVSWRTKKRSRTLGSSDKKTAGSLTINVNGVFTPKVIRLFGKWIECTLSSTVSMAVQNQGKKGWTSSLESKDNNEDNKRFTNDISRHHRKKLRTIDAFKIDGVSSPKFVRLFGTWIQSPESSRVSMAVQNQGRKGLTASLEAKDNNDDNKLGLKVCSMAIKKSSTLIGAINLQNNGEAQHDAFDDREQRTLGVPLGQKVLTKSDTDSSSRLLLGRNLVMTEIMPLLNEEVAKLCNTLQGASIRVWDLDTRTEHSLVLKTWITNSFVFTGCWGKDFVKRRNLKKDDEIGLYWDRVESRLNFTVLRQVHD